MQVHSQKSLEPAGLNHQPKLKVKAKGDARMPATHSLAWILLYRNKAAELWSAPRVCLSPLFPCGYLMRGQEAYGDLGHRAEVSANLPDRCCRWGIPIWGCMEGRNALSPSSHCVRSPLHLSRWIIHNLSRLLPSSSCRKVIALFFPPVFQRNAVFPAHSAAQPPPAWRINPHLPAIGLEKHMLISYS